MNVGDWVSWDSTNGARVHYGRVVQILPGDMYRIRVDGRHNQFAQVLGANLRKAEQFS